MTCSIVLQISSAEFEYSFVEHFFQTWRSVKASWPYFFLLDVSSALSSYCCHICVRRWRRMDAKDARRGFMRRETAEKILQVATFDETNCPARAENILYSGYLQNIISSAVLRKSQRQRGRLLQGFLTLPGHRFELTSSVNNLPCRQISKTQRLSYVFPGPGSLQEPVLDASSQLHDRTLFGSQRQSRKLEGSEQC